ncbi:MAG: motility-associated protein, partial [Burkholderiales bacterium]
MFVLIGYVVACAMIFGGYAAAGGHLAGLWQPLEVVMIFGGALGACIVAYGGKPLKGVIKALPKIFKSSPYNKAFFMDLFALHFELLSKVRKEGLMSIEGDVENPEGSPIFSKYPSIVHDHHVTDFIADYLRLMVGGNLNAFEIENLMDIEIEGHHHEELEPA